MNSDFLAIGNILVPLDKIPTDEAAQPRVKPRVGMVRDYAAAMKTQLAEGNWRFPPVILFAEGETYHLGDGCHRVLAARLAGLTEIAAEVCPGTRRDAILFGISANNTHGLPRTNADKRKAVKLLLDDLEWSQWSNREIARRCLVDHKTVTNLRCRASGEIPQMRQRKAQRGGVIYEMNVKDGANAKRDGGVELADALGIPLPEVRKPVFLGLSDFQEAKELIDRLTGLLDRIAQSPAGELYRQDMVRVPNQGGYASADLRICRNKLLAAEPYCGYCPLCYRTNPSRPALTCKTCGGRGWTSRNAFEACSSNDREYILKLRRP